MAGWYVLLPTLLPKVHSGLYIQFLTILELSYTAFLYSKTALYSAVYVARGRKLRKRRGKKPFKREDIIRIYRERRIKYNRIKSTSNA